MFPLQRYLLRYFYIDYLNIDEFIREEYNVVRMEIGEWKMTGPSLCLENST